MGLTVWAKNTGSLKTPGGQDGVTKDLLKFWPVKTITWTAALLKILLHIPPFPKLMLFKRSKIVQLVTVSLLEL